MDELTKYVLFQYGGFITPLEHKAMSLMFCAEKPGRPAATMLERLKELYQVDYPQIEALLQQGEERFLVSVRDRILKEHAAEVIINRCGKCHALARTPLAKQCVACGHDWH